MFMHVHKCIKSFEVAFVDASVGRKFLVYHYNRILRISVKKIMFYQFLWKDSKIGGGASAP